MADGILEIGVVDVLVQQACTWQRQAAHLATADGNVGRKRNAMQAVVKHVHRSRFKAQTPNKKDSTEIPLNPYPPKRYLTRALPTFLPRPLHDATYGYATYKVLQHDAHPDPIPPLPLMVFQLRPSTLL